MTDTKSTLLKMVNSILTATDDLTETSKKTKSDGPGRAKTEWISLTFSPLPGQHKSMSLDILLGIAANNYICDIVPASVAGRNIAIASLLSILKFLVDKVGYKIVILDSLGFS